MPLALKIVEAAQHTEERPEVKEPESLYLTGAELMPLALKIVETAMGKGDDQKIQRFGESQGCLQLACGIVARPGWFRAPNFSGRGRGSLAPTFSGATHEFRVGGSRISIWNHSNHDTNSNHVISVHESLAEFPPSLAVRSMHSKSICPILLVAAKKRRNAQFLASVIAGPL